MTSTNARLFKTSFNIALKTILLFAISYFIFSGDHLLTSLHRSSILSFYPWWEDGWNIQGCYETIVGCQPKAEDYIEWPEKKAIQFLAGYNILTNISENNCKSLFLDYIWSKSLCICTRLCWLSWYSHRISISFSKFWFSCWLWSRWLSYWLSS